LERIDCVEAVLGDKMSEKLKAVRKFRLLPEERMYFLTG
jgi:hypothetical protein